jgi:hypothetical protein
VGRLRAELRRTGHRVFSPLAERDLAHAVVDALAEQATAPVDGAGSGVA